MPYAVSAIFLLFALAAPAHAQTFFNNWRSGFVWNLPADAEPLADPDGDGFNNLSEYAFGTDPLRDSPEDRALLPAIFNDSAHGTVCFRFFRDRTLADIALIPETSIDLKNRTTVPDAQIRAHPRFEGYELCLVEVTSSPAEPRRFFRLRIKQSDEAGFIDFGKEEKTAAVNRNREKLYRRKNHQRRISNSIRH